MSLFTFQPVQDDIRRQLDATHELLDVIDDLKVIEESSSESQKVVLSQIQKRLAHISDELADNAGRTSEFIRKVAL